MGLNRMMFVKKSAGSGGGDEPANMFIMTMGQQGSQYGYSRYNANNIGEVISYQGYATGFYTYVQRVPSNVTNMFTAANVGKKYKIEIVFN